MIGSWPLLLDRSTMCRFTSMSWQRLERAVRAGVLPASRELLPGLFLWHRGEVETRLAEVYHLDSPETRRQAERQAAEDALNAFAAKMAADRAAKASRVPGHRALEKKKPPPAKVGPNPAIRRPRTQREFLPSLEEIDAMEARREANRAAARAAEEDIAKISKRDQPT